MEYSIMERHGFKRWLGVLPGCEWLSQHEHDLDGWQPTVELNLGHVRYKMRIKDTTVINQICKVNKIKS